MNTKSILAIDDSITNLRIIEKIIGKNFEHIQFRGLRNGERAIQYLKQCTSFPDIIFLDISMPGMDGIETLQAIKSMNNGAQDIPVIMCTANRERETIHKVIELKARDYIIKPIDENTMISKLLSVINFDA